MCFWVRISVRIPKYCWNYYTEGSRIFYWEWLLYLQHRSIYINKLPRINCCGSGNLRSRFWVIISPSQSAHIDQSPPSPHHRVIIQKCWTHNNYRNFLRASSLLFEHYSSGVFFITIVEFCILILYSIT